MFKLSLFTRQDYESFEHCFHSSPWAGGNVEVLNRKNLNSMQKCKPLPKTNGEGIKSLCVYPCACANKEGDKNSPDCCCRYCHHHVRVKKPIARTEHGSYC